MDKYRTDKYRPENFDQYIGQRKLKVRLKVHIEAALKREEPFPHCLMSAVPGAGKTSLARIIALELGDNFKTIIMPVQDHILLEHVETTSGILFMDEIHRTKKSQQESLLTLLEEGYIQNDRGWKIEAGWLSVVGATTEPEKIIPPLWDRFVIKQPFEPYTKEEMGRIAKGMAEKAGISLSHKTLIVLASAAAGVPRNLRQLIVAAKDIRDTSGRSPHAHEILDLCRTEQDGLNADHLDYLKALYSMGGRAGLEALSMMLRRHKTIITDLERLLLEREFVRYGGRGRELTGQGRLRIQEKDESGNRKLVQKTRSTRGL